MQTLTCAPAEGKDHEFWRKADLGSSSSLALGKVLHFPVSQFPHFEVGGGQRIKCVYKVQT